MLSLNSVAGGYYKCTSTKLYSTFNDRGDDLFQEIEILGLFTIDKKTGEYRDGRGKTLGKFKILNSGDENHSFKAFIPHTYNKYGFGIKINEFEDSKEKKFIKGSIFDIYSISTGTCVNF